MLALGNPFANFVILELQLVRGQGNGSSGVLSENHAQKQVSNQSHSLEEKKKYLIGLKKCTQMTSDENV